jgi:hypothetical protein
MQRSIDELRRKGARLGRSLADALGRHLVASGRRARARLGGLVYACSALPIDATASPHALAAGLIAAGAGLVPVPGGPLGGALVERITARATRAIAIRRARRLRALLPPEQTGHSWIVPANDVSRTIARPSFRLERATWSRLARHARNYAFESLPIAGPVSHLARAASAGIEAWSVVVAADLSLRDDLDARVRANVSIALYGYAPCDLLSLSPPRSLPAPVAIATRQPQLPRALPALAVPA